VTVLLEAGTEPEALDKVARAGESLRAEVVLEPGEPKTIAADGHVLLVTSPADRIRQLAGHRTRSRAAQVEAVGVFSKPELDPAEYLAEIRATITALKRWYEEPVV
jgi:hypothetical protein